MFSHPSNEYFCSTSKHKYVPGFVCEGASIMIRNISSWEWNSGEYISYRSKARLIFCLFDRKVGICSHPTEWPLNFQAPRSDPKFPIHLGSGFWQKKTWILRNYCFPVWATFMSVYVCVGREAAQFKRINV